MTTIPRSRAWLRLIAWVVALFLAWATPALADDCLRDPLNANDCLRTPGTAQVIAGVTSVVVTVLVNGQEIVRTVLEPQDGQQPSDDGDGDEEEEPRELQLQIDTRDASGAARTELNVDEQDRIYIYARCIELRKGALPAATQSIRFQLTAGQGWVTVSDRGMQYGSRIAAVDTAQPTPESPMPESVTVYVSATFEGQSVGAPVNLSLTSSQYILEVT
jgi:hypothetical protein